MFDGDNRFVGIFIDIFSYIMFRLKKIKNYEFITFLWFFSFIGGSVSLIIGFIFNNSILFLIFALLLMLGVSITMLVSKIEEEQ